ncbi:MAG: Transcription elongation factor B (SIII), polypeptide 1 (15kDa, elongin C) [Alectoria fallacina]|uniref:Elongin-C n=1 Tax=Alectoria fallacina TaxID=1903189 RepID=A0A8H3IWQ2_9LECA|nr:MAG: Transcription elongation factor B (SIII), polypeptide 1 (15kDa, elongin C) [Alectoria fallacina]
MAASSSPYVTLISNDGFEFIIRREAACVAGTIKKMLDPQSACALPFDVHAHAVIYTMRVTILTSQNNHSGVVLEKVCEYLYYNLKHKDEKDVPDMEIPPELCLELLMAADYLHV